MVLQILFFVAILALLGILVRQAREQRLVVIGIAVLIAFLPFGCLPFSENFRLLGTKIMATSIIVAFIFNRSRQFTWQPLFYAIVGVYLLNFVGLLPTSGLGLANRRIDVMIPLVLFPVLFSMVQLSRRNVMLLLRFFVWIVITVCVYGLIGYVSAVYEFSLKNALIEGKRYAHLFIIAPMIWHPSALTVVLLMALPVSLYLRYHDGKQITLAEMSLAIFLPMLVMLLIGARVGVAVAPVLLLLGYLFYCKFKPILKWGFLATGTIVGLCFIFFVLPPEIKERFADPLRVAQRMTAISAIQEKPILGWGTWQQHGLMICEERADRLGIPQEHRHPFHHFHNQYFDTMVQFGIVGLIVLLGFMLWTFWVAIRNKHFLLLSFMAMYAIVFYFDNILSSHTWMYVFMFWFAFLVANQKNLVESKTQV